MKKKLVILGTGQQAKVLADELIFLKKVKLIGFFKIDKTKKKILLSIIERFLFFLILKKLQTTILLLR